MRHLDRAGDELRQQLSAITDGTNRKALVALGGVFMTSSDDLPNVPRPAN